MATLIKADGTQRKIQPANGTDFQLKELQEYVGGYIEVVDLGNGEILVVNEDGKYISGADYNEAATNVALSNVAICAYDYIAGDAVMCKSEELK